MCSPTQNFLFRLETTRIEMPKSEETKPRGKMTAYAFFVQTCREEHKRKHPEEQVVFTEFSRKCADRWKTMSDFEKKRFNMLAENDKKRYDVEIATFNVEAKNTTAEGKKRRRKAKKDPNAPKRNLTSFFFFSNDERPKVKEVNPQFSIGETAKEIGKRWADIDPKVKAKYEKLSENDKIRYEKEKAEYEEQKKNGVDGGDDTVDSDSD